MSCSLVGESDVKCKVSSILNRSSKQFGPRFMFDGKEDTCWNSDQGEVNMATETFDITFDCGEDNADAVSSKKQSLAEAMKKREEARQATMNERRRQKEKATADREQRLQVLKRVKEDIAKTRAKLDKADKVEKANLGPFFDSLISECIELQNVVTEAVTILPKYDLRKSQESIEALKSEVTGKKELFMPRKRFAFAAAKSKAAPAVTPTPPTPDTEPVVHEVGEFGVEGKTGETITMSVEMKDVLLRSLKSCTVKLFGCPSTLHMAELTDCTVYCGPCATSVFIDDSRDTTFHLACQQLRVHSTEDCTFFMFVTSRVIIEDTRRVRFGQFRLRYDGMDDDFLKAGLRQDAHNNWDRVDDFNWLARDVKSPNWDIISPDQDLTNHVIITKDK